MKRTHYTEGSGVVVVDDNDPFITYNDEMKRFAANIFQEAEERGWTSTEEKVRYLTGKIFEKSPFGFQKGSTTKDSIELFNGLMSDDKEQHDMMCVNKAILQRGLLESQGIKTRNHMYQVVAFSYPFKPEPDAPRPVLPESIQRMHREVTPALRELIKWTGGIIPPFPHLTMDMCTREDKNTGECHEWKTIDATFDNTTKQLNRRPIPDPTLILGEDIPKTIKEYSDKYVTSHPLIHLFFQQGANPPWRGIINWMFQLHWFKSLMAVNDQIKRWLKPLTQQTVLK